jgi:hypothetical protein
MVGDVKLVAPNDEVDMKWWLFEVGKMALDNHETWTYLSHMLYVASKSPNSIPT